MHEKQSQRRFRAFRDRVTAVLAAFGLLIAATGVLMLAGPSATAGTDGDDDGDVEQVSYCHFPEGNLDNPQLLTTSVNAFFISGHPNHSADIVAAFSYAKHGETITFAGMNLDKLSQLDTGCTARPADEVQTETSEGPPNCDTNQVTITTTTTRTSYVWDAKEQEWTAGTPLVTSQTSTRDATLQECPAPDKPQPIVDVKTQEAVDCAEGLVTTTTTTSTTDWELVGNVWVKKSPVTETSTSTRPATAQECPPNVPEKPQPVVDQNAVPSLDCTTGVVTTVTTTTTTDWVLRGNKWVPGTPVTSTETNTRPATDEECPLTPPTDTVTPPTGTVGPTVDQCPNITGTQPKVPSGMTKDSNGDCLKPDVAGTDTASPTPAGQPTVRGTEAVPTAVDAGLGGPPTASVSSSGDLFAQLLVAGGLALMLLAGWMQVGRLTRGAHEV